MKLYITNWGKVSIKMIDVLINSGKTVKITGIETLPTIKKTAHEKEK
jgi:hypothetical protein